MTPVPPDARAALRTGAIACPVDDLAVLRFDGADAASFLQGQLSSDVAALSPGALQRSSYNSAKGRMLASLLLVRPAAEADGAFRALLAADLADSVARRLSMFVMRAKVTVRSEAGSRVIVGVAGPRAAEAVADALSGAPAPGSAVGMAHGLALGLPDGRILLDVAADAAPPVLEALGRTATLAPPVFWTAVRIAAGVPLVTLATTDQFVPQMLNLDALGGVSFRKGCYPGQEIVARMQYLGRLKERLYALHHDGETPGAGTRLFGAAFGDQPCGTVINAAATADGSDLLVVAQRSAAEGGVLHLGAPDGPALAPRPLPYPVPEPAPPRGRLA